MRSKIEKIRLQKEFGDTPNVTSWFRSTTIAIDEWHFDAFKEKERPVPWRWFRFWISSKKRLEWELGFIRKYALERTEKGKKQSRLPYPKRDAKADTLDKKFIALILINYLFLRIYPPHMPHAMLESLTVRSSFAFQIITFLSFCWRKNKSASFFSRRLHFHVCKKEKTVKVKTQKRQKKVEISIDARLHGTAIVETRQ